MMAANTKDFRCQKLPNHLQNPHLLRYTLLTVKYTIYSTKGKTMTRIKSEGFIRLFTRFESLGHFSREKKYFLDGQNSRILEGRRIFTVQNC